MANTRRTFVRGKMDKDNDERSLPDGAYRHAENVIILNSEGSEVGSVQNSLSNKQLTNYDFGTNVKCNLGYCDEAEDKIYWFIISSNGCYLVEWNNRNTVLSIVLADTRAIGSRVLDLNENFLITGIEKIISEDTKEDLLIWTDDNMEPCCVNIERAKTWPVNGFVEEDILLIKKPPRYAPSILPIYSNELSNYIEEKFLSISYRYKYRDGERSALSSYSNYQFNPKPFKLDYQTVENLGMVNAFNAIRIGFNTGEPQVTDIEIIVKNSNSNALYLIASFNKIKEGWADNDLKNISFSNNKLYSVLASKELYRAFDNVPLKAKALSLIGNRPVFGNYLEGRDIVDANKNKIKLDYEVALNSESIEGTALTTSFEDEFLTINIPSDIVLTTGNRLSFTIEMESLLYNGKYSAEFDYILTADFADANALAVDPDFIQFIEIAIKNDFLQRYTIDLLTGWVYDSEVTFTISASTSTSITIQGIKLIFQVDDTPLDPEDDVFHTEEVQFNFIAGNLAKYYKNESVSSLKTNRDYEAAIIYLDKYNRSTTVLAGFNNTIYIQQKYSTSKNRLQLAINHPAPYWADRYKIVIKQQELSYQTIYATTFYEDGIFRWVKLDGENHDKVKQGDILILKKGRYDAAENVIKVKVIEVVQQPENFLGTNVTSFGLPITERAGLYMKIKPTGFSMNYEEDEFYASAGYGEASNDRPYAFSPLFTKENPPGTFTDIPIRAGYVITIILSSSGRGDTGYFEHDYIVQNDYDNIQDWFIENVQGTLILAHEGQVYSNVNIVRGFVNTAFQGIITSLTYADPGYLFLQAEGVIAGNGMKRKGYLNTLVTIRASDAMFIFETEPKVSDSNVYYETEETFDIINGEHQGNFGVTPNQDIATMQPANLLLDFFNCYVQGNGAESYRVKDALLKPFLNVDLRPSATSVEEYKAVRRYADLTYGEAFIESTNMNGLNEFNLSTGNFKELDKQYGSIQKLISRDNDLVVLQEEKSSKVLFGRDALYNADGSANITSIKNVLGAQVTYLGENGIGKHPESVAVYDYQIYSANPLRGVMQRLSIDGITEIVDTMLDWWRDLFRLQPNAKMIGAIDPYLKQYVYSVGEEPVRVYELECGNTIVKNNQSEPFTYTLNLNEMIGDIDFNYNITEGNVTIVATYNSIDTVVSNVTGEGVLTIYRNNLSVDTVTITITPISDAASYEITNLCPVGIAMTIVSMVVNDSGDLTKTINNRFRWSGGAFFNSNDIFDDVPVSRFDVETGVEGVGKFPASGSIVNLQSFKDASATGLLNIEQCNRIGYLVSSTIYTDADFQTILDAATFVSLTTTTPGVGTSQSSGNFLFNRTDPSEILYLIWDYTDRAPVLVDDSVAVEIGESFTIDSLLNDTGVEDGIVTIATEPEHGTAVVNVDNTITYENDGEDFTSDTIVYQVSDGDCSSQATITINIFDPNNYCVVWNSENAGNIKMELQGEINLSELLAGRTISFVSGSITEYRIDGVDVPCSIPMTHNATKLLFEENDLPTVTDRVLTQITFSADIIFNDASELSISGIKTAVSIPGVQMTAEYNDCD